MTCLLTCKFIYFSISPTYLLIGFLRKYSSTSHIHPEVGFFRKCSSTSNINTEVHQDLNLVWSRKIEVKIQEGTSDFNISNTEYWHSQMWPHRLIKFHASLPWNYQSDVYSENNTVFAISYCLFNINKKPIICVTVLGNIKFYSDFPLFSLSVGSMLSKTLSATAYKACSVSTYLTAEIIMNIKLFGLFFVLAHM